MTDVANTRVCSWCGDSFSTPQLRDVSRPSRFTYSQDTQRANKIAETYKEDIPWICPRCNSHFGVFKI
jgi:hypothetical protein